MEWAIAFVAAVAAALLSLETLGHIQRAGYRLSLGKKAAKEQLRLALLALVWAALTSAAYALEQSFDAEYALWLYLGVFSLSACLDRKSVV